MKSEQRAEQLRAAFSTAERTGAGRPYPERLRSAAVEHWRERKVEGAGLREVASELGLSGVSLLRWSSKDREGGAGFHAIELVAEPLGPAATAVVVHGPRGLRVEGLGVAELAELIMRLS